MVQIENEKRAAARIEKSIYMKYRLASGSQWSESETLDISVGGARLQGGLFARRNDLLELKFCLQGNLVHCKLQVTHANRSIAGGYFVGMRHSHKASLREIIYS